MSTNEKSIGELEVYLMASAEEMRLAGMQWADASSLYDQLEDFKKVCLSDAMPKLGKLDPKMSQAEKEQIALGSDAYKNHLSSLSVARRKANEAKVRYSAAQAKFDAVRTIMTNRRELTKRGIDS